MVGAIREHGTVKWSASAVPRRVANASGNAVSARFFHSICTGCTPTADASSLNVRSPRRAATVTFRLNAPLVSSCRHALRRHGKWLPNQ